VLLPTLTCQTTTRNLSSSRGTAECSFYCAEKLC